MADPPKITALMCLPVFYNPDEHGHRKPVEDRQFNVTAEELTKEFGGCVVHNYREQPLAPRGFWWNSGVIYEDVLALIEVDIPDGGDARAWLRTYTREVLLERFQQRAIYIKLVGPIETLEVSHEEI